MNKVELEAYARKAHNVELDRRKTHKDLLTQVKELEKKPEVVKAAVIDIAYEKPVKELTDYCEYIVKNPNGSQYVTNDIEHFARVWGFTIKSMQKIGWEIIPIE